LLPGSLTEALDALERDSVFRNELGGVFVDYFLKLKRNEAGRFQRWLDDHAIRQQDDETTVWEQNEYFDFF
jgi:glutamine synthetase